jgi:hypothetical protein
MWILGSKIVIPCHVDDFLQKKIAIAIRDNHLMRG